MLFKGKNGCHVSWEVGKLAGRGSVVNPLTHVHGPPSADDKPVGLSNYLLHTGVHGEPDKKKAEQFQKILNDLLTSEPHNWIPEFATSAANIHYCKEIDFVSSPGMEVIAANALVADREMMTIEEVERDVKQLSNHNSCRLSWELVKLMGSGTVSSTP